MKIGIMGSHSTGKTTFAKRLFGECKLCFPDEQIIILPEVARRCPFPINQHASEEAQRWIFLQQYLSEIELSAKYEILICDRTIIDSLAYSERAGYQEIVNDFLLSALNWMDTYDQIYFLRPNGVPPVADGFRDTSIVFQTDIDLILKDYIDIYALPVQEITIGGANGNTDAGFK